jgi:RNA polymerase sigma-70 factor (ECF subfamily)
MTALIDAMEDDRDRRLVERHQAGDDAAFAQLYALHYGRLVRFCRRLVRDPHTAEEVAQDAFLRAYTSLDRFEGDRRFYPWLTVIARRLVIDRLRRDSRVDIRANVEAGLSGAAEDVAVQRIEGDHLLTALERVRDRHRQVLHLRDWEGLSYEAIAERLGLARTAVPPLLHRARQALRREYLLVTEGRVAALLRSRRCTTRGGGHATGSCSSPRGYLTRAPSPRPSPASFCR